MESVVASAKKFHRTPGLAFLLPVALAIRDEVCTLPMEFGLESALCFELLYCFEPDVVQTVVPDQPLDATILADLVDHLQHVDPHVFRRGWLVPVRIFIVAGVVNRGALLDVRSVLEVRALEAIGTVRVTIAVHPTVSVIRSVLL